MPWNKKYLKCKQMNDSINGYKELKETKRDIIYTRMDDSMIERLRAIRDKSGISVSEIIREAVRRLFKQVDKDGGITLEI